MKNLKLKTAALMLAAVMLTISSCKKENGYVNPEINYTEFNGNSPEIDDFGSTLEETFDNPIAAWASETIDITLQSDGVPTEVSGDEFEGAPQGPGFKNENFRCRKIFDSFPLTDLQKKQLMLAHKRFVECRQDVIQRLKMVNHEIVERGRIARAYLLKQFQDGKITKDQLLQGIKAINDKVRSELKNDERRINVKKALKACFEHHLRGVKGILTPEQWKAWVYCKKH